MNARGTCMKQAFAALSVFLSSSVLADVWCGVKNVQVHAYDHGGVYVAGTIEGGTAGNFSLCGTNGDCASRATDRRLSLAVAAQVTGRDLNTYWAGKASCTELTNWQVP